MAVAQAFHLLPFSEVSLHHKTYLIACSIIPLERDVKPTAGEFFHFTKNQKFFHLVKQGGTCTGRLLPVFLISVLAQSRGLCFETHSLAKSAN